MPVDVPAAFREDGPWKTAQPATIDAQHRWWQLYGDAVLDDLIAQAERANQNIAQAEAQYRAADAIAAQARSALWPAGGISAGASRTRAARGIPPTTNLINLGVSASWQPDFWGGLRRSIEAGDASAEASSDDLAAVRLSIRSAVAQNYLQLRVVDVQRDLYAATVEAYGRSLQTAQAQYKAGVALRSDVALAQSQLKTAQAQGVDLEASRGQLEHALAILTGQPPANFTVAPIKSSVAELRARLPVTPAGLPSALLERRPDIAAAERRVASANASIGVARAAYYPSVTLNASGGYGAGAFGALLDTPSRVWSLGASLAQTLFDGGFRNARSAQAVASYDATVAQYKQTVLTGFQQVEDNLSTLRVLDQEGQLLDEAVQASQVAERSVLSQYRAGTATYFAVVTAQTLSLNNERSVTQVVGRQLAASVSLVTATGGGWQPGQDLSAAEPAPMDSSTAVASAASRAAAFRSADSFARTPPFTP